MKHTLRTVTPPGYTTVRSEEIAAIQYPDSPDEPVIIILKGGYWFTAPVSLENASALALLRFLSY